jgi:hypothetical protein
MCVDIRVNKVAIKVMTTLGDYMKTLPDNKAARIWTEPASFYLMASTQPVRLVTIR